MFHHQIMNNTPRVLLCLFLVAAVYSLSIDCDNYLTLTHAGVSFKVSGGTGVRLAATGLPQGLTLRDNSLVPVSTVTPGQYIIAVKAIDSTNHTDQKIIILNVEADFNAAANLQSPAPAPKQPDAPAPTATSSASLTTSTSSSSTSSSASSSATGSIQISSSVSSFDSGSKSSASLGQNSGSNSVDSLQSYFNQIDVSSPPATSNSSNVLNLASTNLNEILSDFSNSSASTNATYLHTQQLSNKNVSVKSLVNISLSDTQKEQSSVTAAQSQAIFQAQKLAAQYVASNYSLVQQLTANKNFANELIVNITRNYQTDQDSQKQVYYDLDVAVKNKSKIESAIANLKAFLNDVNSQITASLNRIGSIKDRKTALLGQKDLSGADAQQIQQTIVGINAQINSTSASILDNGKQCDALNGNLVETNKSINILNLQASLAGQQLDLANKDVIARQATVDDLIRQLAQARKLLQTAQDNVTVLKNQQTNLQVQISTTTNSFTQLGQNLGSCKTKTEQLQKNLATLRSNLALTQNSLTQATNKKENQANQIASLDVQLTQEQTANANLQTQFSSGSSALNVLTQALPNASSVLNSQLLRKQQIDAQIQNDEESLNAAIARYKNESSALQIATMNLQNARAVSQQADQAVNKLLASRGNVLPYAIAVSSADSALIGQTIVNPAINISNWFNFLSANFGQAASIYLNEDISSLYSIAPSKLKSNLPCPAASSLVSYTGHIQAIKNGNQLVVSRDDGNKSEVLELPDCAELYSTIPNYSLKVGDGVIVKGDSQKGSTLVKQLICLSA